MCELMCLNFAKPIAADFSIRVFAERGVDNADGWGLAWYPDRAAALIKEPVGWGASQFKEFLEEYRGLEAKITIAHVRHRTTGGPPCYADTHPFVRELAGHEFLFAHNGTLAGDFWKLPLMRFRPVGATDSEFLFCYLLAACKRWEGLLAAKKTWPRLHELLQELNRFGKLNCIFSDGKRVFCYHDGNAWKGLTFRKVAIRDGGARRFEDATVKLDLAGEPLNYGVVVATTPLSADGWHRFHPGELIVLEDGLVRYSSHRKLEGTTAVH